MKRVVREGDEWRVTWETAQGEESALVKDVILQLIQIMREKFWVQVLVKAWTDYFFRGRCRMR